MKKPKHLNLTKQAIYFITTSTKNRRRVFGVSTAADLFIRKLVEYQKMFGLVIYGYCLLPEHLHIMLLAETQKELSTIIFRIKGGSSRLVNQLHGNDGPIWQDRYHDHVVRDDRDFANHLDYIHRNAVRHKLVSRPEDWAWSSYRFYLKRGYYEIGWGYDV